MHADLLTVGLPVPIGPYTYTLCRSDHPLVDDTGAECATCVDHSSRLLLVAPDLPAEYLAGAVAALALTAARESEESATAFGSSDRAFWRSPAAVPRRSPEAWWLSSGYRLDVDTVRAATGPVGAYFIVVRRFEARPLGNVVGALAVVRPGPRLTQAGASAIANAIATMPGLLPLLVSDNVEDLRAEWIPEAEPSPEILFTRHGIALVPILPLARDGSARRADGSEYLSLADAAAFAAVPPEQLVDAYEKFLDAALDK